MTVAGTPSPTARRDLMAACRALMRNLLLSQEAEGSEWTKRLESAVRHVEEAVRCVQPFGEPNGAEEGERIADGLAKLYLAKLLTKTLATPVNRDNCSTIAATKTKLS